MTKSACKGRIIFILENLGFSKNIIKETLKQFDANFKKLTEDEAEKLLIRSNY